MEDFSQSPIHHPYISFGSFFLFNKKIHIRIDFICLKSTLELSVIQKITCLNDTSFYHFFSLSLRRESYWQTFWTSDRFITKTAHSARLPHTEEEEEEEKTTTRPYPIPRRLGSHPHSITSASVTIARNYVMMEKAAGGTWDSLRRIACIPHHQTSIKY